MTIFEWLERKYDVFQPIKEWYGDFECYDQELTSFEGCSEIVHGCFRCQIPKKISVKELPKKVTENLYIECIGKCYQGIGFKKVNNDFYTKSEIKSVCKVYGKIMV